MCTWCIIAWSECPKCDFYNRAPSSTVYEYMNKSQNPAKKRNLLQYGQLILVLWDQTALSSRHRKQTDYRPVNKREHTRCFPLAVGQLSLRWWAASTCLGSTVPVRRAASTVDARTAGTGAAEDRLLCLLRRPDSTWVADLAVPRRWPAIARWSVVVELEIVLIIRQIEPAIFSNNNIHAQ